MEDRSSAGLYLEMSDADPASYARDRVPEVLGLPGASRATWWRNLKPERDEFPRRIPEFRTLGVFEVDERFVPSVLPDSIRGHYFRRTIRPAQGNLSGKPTLGLELVLVSPRTPDGAQAFRDWADFVHIRQIAAASVPGFTMITPYENASGGSPRFLHFYEMDTADAEEAFQQMTPVTIERRLKPLGKDAFSEWAGHDQLVIEYVNTFTRVGERVG